MMKRRLFAIGLLTSSLYPATSQAFWFTRPVGRAGRQAAARDQGVKYEKLHAAVPTLSPAEAQWVKKELDESWFNTDRTKISERYVRLIEGREFNIQAAKKWTTDVTNSLRLLKGTIDRQNEMIQWAVLAENFTSTAISRVSKLVELKVVEIASLPIGGIQMHQVDGALSSMATLTAHSIIENVLQPYLAGTLLP